LASWKHIGKDNRKHDAWSDLVSWKTSRKAGHWLGTTEGVSGGAVEGRTLGTDLASWKHLVKDESKARDDGTTGEYWFDIKEAIIRIKSLQTHEWNRNSTQQIKIPMNK
jgi:hypothetical protein